jgi:transcriptional regulator GlxA family with amidase domain
MFEIHVSDTTRSFFYGMIPYFNQGTPPAESLLELKFKELLLNLLSDPQNSDMLAYIRSIEGQRKTPVWQVMESNYIYNLSVGEFARLAQRSIAAFNRDFREYYGTTPGKWLSEKRLSRARQLLHGSERSVSEIADDCGFENLTHFSRVFKEKYSLSPMQYRKNEKEKHLNVSEK